MQVKGFANNFNGMSVAIILRSVFYVSYFLSDESSLSDESKARRLDEEALVENQIHGLRKTAAQHQPKQACFGRTESGANPKFLCPLGD